MYVSTFYSFKGGVGRTMALVNVAFDLVRRGRTVLAVDFDLEAPGLDTYALAETLNPDRGLVDFINEYLSSGHAPSADQFIYEVRELSDDNGALWIMPSGSPGNAYASQLAGIDWASLYHRYDGYLLLEYLKTQWESLISPDYVLIDSRTGHTDVGGICTRQLPDCVVIMFFPNDQNLRGLTKVVRDIRGENTRTLQKNIDLHFVMSNVPDLDDEDRILKNKIRSFQVDLGFDRDPLVIHHYNSLSLLNQVIFTKDRPRSRLAKEYHDLCRTITRLNPEDRDGSLEYLKSNWETPPRSGPARHTQGISHETLTERLKIIEERQSSDQDVMFQLGKYFARWGRFKEAVKLFDKAVEAGYTKGDLFVERGSILRDFLDNPNRASQDAVDALKSPNLSLGQVRRALSMLAPKDLQVVEDSAAIKDLSGDERVLIAAEFDKSTKETMIAQKIICTPLENIEEEFDPDHCVRVMALISISLRRFDYVLSLVQYYQQQLKWTIQLYFNYGMAIWGSNGMIDRAPFDRVLELDKDSSTNTMASANYLQCLSIAYWATGDRRMARDFADRSIEVIERSGGLEFSCWRYLRVSPDTFLQDTEEIIGLIEGDDGVIPRFMREV